METTTKQCSCKHDFQDKTYGKGNRLMNECKDGKAFRCTICGKEHSANK